MIRHNHPLCVASSGISLPSLPSTVGTHQSKPTEQVMLSPCCDSHGVCVIANSIQPGGAAQGALSVMKLPAGRTIIQQFIQRTMKPLIVEQSQGKEQSKKSLLFTIPCLQMR